MNPLPITDLGTLAQQACWTLIGYVKEFAPWCLVLLGFVLVLRVIIAFSDRIINVISGKG